MLDLGTVKPGKTIYIPFASFAGSTGANITMSGLAAGDVLIYKDGGTTQRASSAGITLLDTDGIDFDSLTGIHGISIDLADNTTADFYKAGSRYFIVIGDITVDSQTVRFVAATFTIGYEGAILDTHIASLSTQTSFTLNAGPAEDDALNGCVVCIHDAASAVQFGFAVVSDYTGSTKTVTLAAGTTFTAAAGDNISIFPPTNVSRFGGSASGTLPTNFSSLSIDANGRLDVIKVAGTTQTARDLGASVLISTGTGSGQLDVTSGRIKADTVYFGGAAGTFASGRPEVNATHFGGTAGTFSIGAGILDVNAQYLQGDTPVTTVATGVYESDPAVYNTASTFGALFNSVLADTNELQTDWVNGGRLDIIVDAILADTNELQTDWADGGRLDLLLDGASSAGDPWTTSLPGAYTGTQAGKILSDILTDTGTTLQAELDGIQADTEDIQSRLPAALVGGRMDASVGAMAANVVTAASTAADFITEIQTAAAAALTAYDTGGGVAKQTTIEDLATEVAAILVDTGTTLPATLTTIANYLDTEIAAILEDTGTTLPAQISALSIPTANQIADALLIRDVDNVEASAPEHSLTTVILACLEMSISGSTMTIKRTDGSTTHVTKTLTTDGDATPITGIA